MAPIASSTNTKSRASTEADLRPAEKQWNSADLSQPNFMRNQEMPDAPAENDLRRVGNVSRLSPTSKVIQAEINDLSPEHSMYLIPGPVLSERAMHAAECQCSAEPSFDESLECAFTSDQRLDELFARIENGNASFAVAGLAKRLRDLERTKRKQIANFTRED